MAKRGPFICPNCGEEVPAGAKSCPGCGSDETTGWSDRTVYDATGIPEEDDFDYDKFLENERLVKPGITRKQIFGLAITVLLLAGFILLYIWCR